MKLLLGFLLLATLPAGAAPPEPLRFFVGKWDCETKELQSRQPAHRSSYEFAEAADGLIARYAEAASDAHSDPFNSDERWTFDPDLRGFVNHWTDSHGGRARFGSSGWNGREWVWVTDEMTMPHGKVAARITYQKTGDSSFRVVVAHRPAGANSGAWVPAAYAECRKE